MAGRHHEAAATPVVADRRHLERRGTEVARRAAGGLKPVLTVLLVAAILSSALVSGALGRRMESEAATTQRELLHLASIRQQAMVVTERAHVELFRSALDRSEADAALVEAVLERWRADLAVVASQLRADFESEAARSVAAQLGRVVDTDVQPLGSGDVILSARTQLMPIQNRLVEGAGQSGLDGPDGAADRTTEQLYVLGIALDVAIAASSNLPEAAPAWTSFGVAIRTLGGAGGLGAFTAGPLSGWVPGPTAASRLTGLVEPLIGTLGDDGPSGDYLVTLGWSLTQLDLVDGDPDAAEAEPVGTTEEPALPDTPDSPLGDVLGDLFEGIDPGLVTSVVTALTPSHSDGPPAGIRSVLDETARLSDVVQERGRAAAFERTQDLAALASDRDASATTLLAIAMGVIGVAVALLVAFAFAARRAQRNSEQASLRDPLTGLLNRTGFARTASRRLAHGSISLALVDLDRFKPVNDSLGHAVGDEVLVAVARTLARAADELGGIAARLGGDEFALAVPDVHEHELDVAIAGLIDDLQVVECGPHRIDLGCSVGVAHGEASEPIEQLLAEADLAMYRAKRSGRGRALHFDDATRTVLARFRDGTIGESIEVGVRLQRSLADRSILGAMVVPQVAGPTGEPLEGAELRLIAEFAGRRFGLLDATLDGIARSGRTIPPAGVRLWFEVSASDVVAYGGVAGLWERLSKVGLSGSPLGVQLLDAGSCDPEALATAVAEIGALGVHVGVGVTGPGAVGVATLARVRAERVVIDPTVIDAVRSGDIDLARTVRAVAELSVGLDAEVVAVGVRSLDVAQLLSDLGVAVAQVSVTEPWAATRPRRTRTA